MHARLAFLLLVLLLPAWSPAQTALRLTIEPRVYGQPLVLGDQLYGSGNGDSLNIEVLRYYISSVQLSGKNGVAYREPNSYHLIDAEEPGSETILLTRIPAGRYDSICFFVGIDSLTNVSGARGGDLDPTKGMYWAWNSGYINFKLEGRSPVCPTRNHAFELHIGGYLPPNPTVRRVVLPLKNGRLPAGKTVDVSVRAELGHFFDRIALATTNSVMQPSRRAAELADYFSAIFQLP